MRKGYAIPASRAGLMPWAVFRKTRTLLHEDGPRIPLFVQTLQKDFHHEEGTGPLRQDVGERPRDPPVAPESTARQPLRRKDDFTPATW